MLKIAIIPARSGSKRLPNKNKRSFLGKPLITYSIDVAIRSQVFDKVVVSSDDEEILEIAQQESVIALRRPIHLATDTSTLSELFLYLLEELELGGDDMMALLQPTQPLRSVNLIRESMAAFELNNRNFDSLITLSKIQLKLGHVNTNQFQPVNYSFEQRSQDMQGCHFENGAFYITKASTIRTNGNIFGSKVYGHVIDNVYGLIDIDDEQDFEIGEMIFDKHKDLFNAN